MAFALLYETAYVLMVKRRGGLSHSQSGEGFRALGYTQDELRAKPSAANERSSDTDKRWMIKG
jgi:hypothetical protein